MFDGQGYPDVHSFLLSTNIVAGNSYQFKVKAKYLNGFTASSADSLPVWACSAPSPMEAPVVTAVSRNSFTVQWSQPESNGACDISGYSVWLNSIEIDSAQVRDKPSYMEHTSSAATVEGSTYIVFIQAYNINGVATSESTAFVLASVPSTPTFAPQADLTMSSHS